MKNFLKINTFFLLILLVLFTACKKDNEEPGPDPNKKGQFKIEFDNIVGTVDLNLGTTKASNSSGEELTISMFNYYISNIKLKTATGTEYVVPQNDSYFLIREEDANSQLITLENVPEGDYTEVSFTIGVDSLRNTKPLAERTGALDPANGMYWSWNSGYIFVKLEGTSPQAQADPNGNKIFRYHIGGFGGMNSATINNIKSKTISFGTDQAKVRETETPQVHILVDALKLFAAPNQLKIADFTEVMWGDKSTEISANYVNMFMYDHIHDGHEH